MASRDESDRSRAVWRSCLAAAFKTGLACTIVGCTTLYGPEAIRREIAFPAFSYVTVILIVTDATLGDTLRGCWLAFYASFQGVFPAILSLWLIGPSRLTTSTTAALVAVSACLVVLPENTHLISKRIALGQIVIVYVIGFINGMHPEPIMHPIRVAASTALGVVACVLALLFPYRSLACHEVTENCKLFTENASERLKLIVKAFLAEDNKSRQALISQEKSLSVSGTKLLHSIKSKQESMQWERFLVMFFKLYCTNPGERLQNLERILRGMEISLTNCSQIPVRLADPELENDPTSSVEEHISNQIKRMPPVMTIIQESQTENDMKFLQKLHTIIPVTDKDLPFLFFLFCLKLLQGKSAATSPKVSGKQGSNDSEKQKKWHFGDICSIPIRINKRRLMPAFKSSLSLGLAVLLGLMYSKENGFWAGLPVAISLASGREATFKLANAKAQGTVIGTVYGTICCFIFGKYIKLRFLSLLPWFIFSKFLCKSKMYGQAGGISAVIGAVLILGRENFGPPSEFAIARIVETFIGLSCSIMVDILLQPTRAATMAKIQLSTTIGTLHKCVGIISFSTISNFEEGQKQFKFQVNELGKIIGEAAAEPNFWFLPFNSACYGKLLESLSKMVDLLFFGAQAIKLLEQESRRIDSTQWKETVSKLDGDLKLFKETAVSAIKCLEEISLIKSLAALDKEFETRKGSLDLELGKRRPIDPYVVQFSSSSEADWTVKNVNSFLRHSDELLSHINIGKDEEEFKNQVILSLGALAFCINSIARETKEIEKVIKEVLQWENPSSQVNLYDILCKIHATANTVTI
ncbi:unnamed protein product [Fraxinus pennsylvanica]|uniref:Integral membrane bound transporter domain-containing protein n=1 Tax=Fraxinus pennsylvanica TaxID=56036 RepID=A0AAD1YQQ1_9LAMI|nr:unnamed protein product [Fraxinus pennsylvanica]